MGAEASHESENKEEEFCTKTKTKKSERKGKMSRREEVRYCGFDISALPEELFIYVLIFVPAKDVVKNCCRVNKYWLEVSRNQSLWRRRCEDEKKFLPDVMGPPPLDFIKFYFQNPYTRNLLRNTHAANLEYWRKPGGYISVSVECHVGADAITDHVPAEEIGDTPVQNWVTSYRFSSLTQQVRLLDIGCSEVVLDQLKPDLYASVWCAARWDCGARFQLVVKLLDQNQKEIDSVEKDLDLSDGAMRRTWHKVEHTFTMYEAGVRSVEFRMGGVDTQFWAGNYGAKFTLPCLRFLFKSRECC